MCVDNSKTGAYLTIEYYDDFVQGTSNYTCVCTMIRTGSSTKVDIIVRGTLCDNYNCSQQLDIVLSNKQYHSCDDLDNECVTPGGQTVIDNGQLDEENTITYTDRSEPSDEPFFIDIFGMYSNQRFHYTII